MTSKFYNDNKPIHKDLTADIDAGLGLGWRILGSCAVPVLFLLFLAICYFGFQMVLSVGVAS